MIRRVLKHQYFASAITNRNAIFSEAEKQELINAAQGAAEAVVAAGKARAQSIQMVSESLGKRNGQNAANLAVAEQYVEAFQHLARTNNTLILPANTGDVTSMVAQAMTIFKQLSVSPGGDEAASQSELLANGGEGGVVNPSASDATAGESTR